MKKGKTKPKVQKREEIIIKWQPFKFLLSLVDTYGLYGLAFNHKPQSLPLNLLNFDDVLYSNVPMQHWHTPYSRNSLTQTT